MVSDALHKVGIGGSEVAAIIGVDDYTDALSVWLDKRGALERGPATPRMLFGKYFEEGIIRYYSALTGRETQFLDITQKHPVYEFMVYTPDAICIHEPRGVDAKLVSWDQRDKWGPTVSQIPARVQLQAHWYMAAMDYPRWDIAAVVGTDSPPLIYTVERDPELEEALLDVVGWWWQRHIVNGEQPRIGTSDNSSRYLRQRFPRARLKLRTANEREEDLLNSYAQVRIEERLINEDRVQIENELKLATGDYEGLTWPRGRFTWRNTRDSVVIDWEALAGSLMQRYGDEEKLALVKEFSTVRPGARRIWFQGPPE